MEWVYWRTLLITSIALKIWSKAWVKRSNSSTTHITPHPSLSRSLVKNNWKWLLTSQTLTPWCHIKRSMSRTSILTFTTISAKSRRRTWDYNKCTHSVLSCSKSLTRSSTMTLATKSKQSPWGLLTTVKNSLEIRIPLSFGETKISFITAPSFHPKLNQRLLETSAHLSMRECSKSTMKLSKMCWQS